MGNVPNLLAITPDGGQLYVANTGHSLQSNTVSVVDTTTNTVTDTITVGLGPWGVAIKP